MDSWYARDAFLIDIQKRKRFMIISETLLYGISRKNGSEKGLIIDRVQLAKALKTRGFNQVHIDEIIECVRIKQTLDRFKAEKGLPNDEAWKEYQEQLDIGN